MVNDCLIIALWCSCATFEAVVFAFLFGFGWCDFWLVWVLCILGLGGWLLFDSWCCGIGLRRVSVFGLGGLVWLVACCDAFCCVGLGLIVVLGGCSGVFRVVGWV